VVVQDADSEPFSEVIPAQIAVPVLQPIGCSCSRHSGRAGQRHRIVEACELFPDRRLLVVDRSPPRLDTVLLFEGVTSADQRVLLGFELQRVLAQPDDLGVVAGRLLCGSACGGDGGRACLRGPRGWSWRS
jgi:hypothetical protein